MPTWLTGALVTTRIAWSAAEVPRKSHRSPVRVRSTAWSSVICEVSTKRYRRRMQWWKWIGMAGLAGVAATGVVIKRDERQRKSYSPEDVRARLHERAAELGEGRTRSRLTRLDSAEQRSPEYCCSSNYLGGLMLTLARTTDLHALIADRHSPRSFDPAHEPGRRVAGHAARGGPVGAPSAMNHQPWRLVVARRGTDATPRVSTLPCPATSAGPGTRRP